VGRFGLTTPGFSLEQHVYVLPAFERRSVIAITLLILTFVLLFWLSFRTPAAVTRRLGSANTRTLPQAPQITNYLSARSLRYSSL
jgi:hypothetical protein